MIFSLPTIRLGRYTHPDNEGEYISCEIVPDETSHEYTLVTLDQEGNLDMRSIGVTEGLAFLDNLDQEGYLRTDPYIPSMRKQAILEKSSGQDDDLLKKLRGQGGAGTAEKLQKGQGKASKWDGGIIDSCNLGPIGGFSGEEEAGATPSEEIITDEELDALSNSVTEIAEDSTGLSLPSGHSGPRAPTPSYASLDEDEDDIDDLDELDEEDLDDEFLDEEEVEIPARALPDTTDLPGWDVDEPEEVTEAPEPSSFLARLQEAARQANQEKAQSTENAPEPSMVKESKKRSR